MGIVNRRNAVIGWVVVKNRKRALKWVAADAVPGAKTGGAAAGALAAAAGALLFWRRAKRGGDVE
jgi:hypothetical protein